MKVTSANLIIKKVTGSFAHNEQQGALQYFSKQNRRSQYNRNTNYDTWNSDLSSAAVLNV